MRGGMENQYGGRRKKRKSVAVVAFDFGSLGLSSAVAEHAIEKVRVHTQTLDATADMSTEEALKLHELEIRYHERGLQEANAIVKSQEVQENACANTTDTGHSVGGDTATSGRAQAEIHAAMLKAHKLVREHRVELSAKFKSKGINEIQHRESVKQMVEVHSHSLSSCASDSISHLADSHVLEQRLQREYSTAWQDKTKAHASVGQKFSPVVREVSKVEASKMEDGGVRSGGAISNDSIVKGVEEEIHAESSTLSSLGPIAEAPTHDVALNTRQLTQHKIPTNVTSPAASGSVLPSDTMPALLRTADYDSEKVPSKAVQDCERAEVAEETQKDSEDRAEAAELALEDAKGRAEVAEQACKNAESRAEAAEQACKDAETCAEAAKQAHKVAESRADIAEQARKDAESRAKAAEQACRDAESRAEVAKEARKVAESRAKVAEQARIDAERRASCLSNTGGAVEVESLSADLKAMVRATAAAAESLQIVTTNVERARADTEQDLKHANAGYLTLQEAESHASLLREQSREEIDSLRADLEVMRKALNEAKMMPGSSGRGRGRSGRLAGTASVDLAQIVVSPVPVSQSVRASPLYAWLVENSTELIDLGQYAQVIHDADIGLASLEILDDDALIADLVPPQTKASHRNLLRRCIRQHCRSKSDSKIEAERVKSLLIYTWLQSIDYGNGDEKELTAYAGLLDRQGLSMQNISALLHEEIASSLIHDSDHRIAIVRAAQAYHEMSCFLSEQRPSSHFLDESAVRMRQFRSGSSIRSSESSWKNFTPPSPGEVEWHKSVEHLNEATKDLAVSGATVNAMQIEAMQDVQTFRRFLTDMKAQVMPQVKGTMNLLPGRPRESKSSRLKHWVAQDMRMDSFSKRHRETSSLNHRRRKKRHQSPYSSTLASATAW